MRRLALVFLLSARTALADEPPVAETTAPAPEPVAVQPEAVPSAVPEPLVHSSFGPLATLGIGSALQGDHLVGELGAQIFGLRELSRAWLVFWDAALAGKAGGLANQHPYTFFGGGVLRGTGELGHRFFGDSAWAPYVSGRVGADLQVLGTPGVPISALNQINNSDGFGGITADGLVRAAFGASYLHGRTSFIVDLFLQEALHAPRTYEPGTAFSELGLALRLDFAESFTLAVEGVLGITPAAGNGALHASTQQTHIEASGFLRKTFKNGVWLGLAMAFGRLGARIAYDGGDAFDTARPPTFDVTASFGIPIGVRL